MFCNKCGHQFEGNFCPKCGAVSKTAVAQEKENPTAFNPVQDEDNPYNVYYNQPVSYSQPQQPQANQPHYEPQFYYQPPRPEPQPQPQPVATPPQNPYQHPYYQNPPYYPPKKEMTTSKIVLIVLVSVLGFFLLMTGCVSCMLAYDEAYLNNYSEDYQIDNQTLYAAETARGENFSYFISDYSTVEKYNGKKPRDGYEFLKVSVEITNISDEIQELYYDISCYEDATLCKKIDSDEEYYEYETLLPDKKYIAEAVFEVPVDANNRSITIVDDYYSEETFTFLLD